MRKWLFFALGFVTASGFAATLGLLDAEQSVPVWLPVLVLTGIIAMTVWGFIALIDLKKAVTELAKERELLRGFADQRAADLWLGELAIKLQVSIDEHRRALRDDPLDPSTLVAEITLACKLSSALSAYDRAVALVRSVGWKAHDDHQRYLSSSAQGDGKKMPLPAA